MALENILPHFRSTLSEAALSKALLYAISAASLYFLVINVLSYWRLHHIPGPLFAKFTNIQRALWVQSNHAHETHVKLHRKYGPIVRFGPNMVSVCDPKEIGTIYSFKKPWPKSDFYRALLLKTSRKPVEGIFATQNEAIHRALKRPIANIYSLTYLLSFEPYVDTALGVFKEQIDARYASKAPRNGEPKTQDNVCNLSQWLQMLAFDVMGELTFSKRFGFMESGGDVDGAMNDLWNNSTKTAIVTQMPWLEPLYTNNPIQRWLRGGGTSPGVLFAASRIAERRSLAAGDLEKEWSVNTRDFLSRFMEVEANESVPPYAMMVWTGSNITAGSDSTAIFLRSLLYHLLHNPKTMEKLLHELDTEAKEGRLDNPAKYRQVNELPYFNACFQEAGRMHPALGLPMERVVPPEGVMLCGKYVPGGTVVGMSSWVTHRDPATFGKDCDVWRPERWLEAGPEEKRRMEKGLLTFGHGHRDCIGKNIALLEIYKIAPTLLRTYHFELLDPSEGGDWEIYNRWFVTQKNFKVRISRRTDV